jgi:hypothetical protein
MNELDQITLARARRGDPAALTTLVQRYGARVHALVARMLVGRPADQLDDLSGRAAQGDRRAAALRSERPGAALVLDPDHRRADLHRPVVVHRMRLTQPLPRGSGTLELFYPHLNLLEGTYLELSLRHRQADDPVCSLAARLEVKSRREDGAGLVRCPWDVRIDRPMYFDETKRQQDLLEGSGCPL